MKLPCAFLIFLGAASAFQCSPDTILRMATDKRLKQLERECYLTKNGEPECETRSDVETAWKDFTKLCDKYRDAVKSCRKTAGRTHRNSSLHSHRRRHTVTIHDHPSVGEQVIPESERFDRPHPIRTKRQICKTKASDELSILRQDFVEHCDRENICLPDEDLPAGAQRDRFKELHGARAKKYSAYLTQLSLCYGRLA